MASLPQDDGAVCSMCGDHGLPHELFRCKSCHVRLQHRYCSDLYPRAAAYRRCNWCLTEEVGPVRRMEKRKVFEAAPSGEVNGNGGCSRTAFLAEAGKPIKKPKAGGGADRAVLPGATKVKKLQAGSKAPFRVKVRRYKLLKEVIISC